MSIKVAINGFGRIGRNVLKASLEKKLKLDIVAVNDLTDTKTLAHLLKYDTSYGRYDKKVEHDNANIIVDGKKIRVLAEKDPSKLPWKEMKIDVVIESTGRFTDKEGMGLHLQAGAKRVVLSAPAKGGGVPTYVLGVNDKDMKGESLINNASCTTNCISPVAEVMHAKFGVAKAVMTTVHGYTQDQNLQDAPHKDLRRARAAAVNMVPTSTGAAIATTEAIPELKGLFDGMAIRVPVPVVSLSDLTFVLKKKVTVEEVNNAFREAAKSLLMKGILDVTDEPLVSSDFIKNPHSAIVDLSLTKVIDGDLVKVIAWYDNEWGYSCRLAEMVERVGKDIE
ncbi:type I glyceraldehyde-3-phosphate dehydrogenase [Candidatus Uhrbacteria bacterium]|nr:type I glyceraldehyde-3-phosphate dehydrogenase [Candidatus Uhrbacteria bacterium]